MRILWLGPNYTYRYNRVHEHLPKAAAQVYDIIRYGHAMDGGPPCEYWGDGVHVPRLVEKYGPIDVLILQHPRHCPMYTGLAEVKIPKVCIVTDYFPWNYGFKNRFVDENRFDLAVFPEQWMAREASLYARFWKPNAKVAWLPFWANTSVFKPLSIRKTYDVMALFSGDIRGGYPNRAAVIATIRSMVGTGLRYYAKLLLSHDGKVTGDNYVRLINEVRIAITSNDRFGSVNFKHFEFPSCGTLMFSDKAKDFEALGFIAGEHYVEYREPPDLPELIRFYLCNDAERARIEQNALVLVQSRHTVQHRVVKLFDLIGYLL